MIQKINHALELDQHNRDDRARREMLNDAFRTLTDRECEVLRLLIDGMSNKEVAREFGLSPKTIERHRANIMRKLAVGPEGALAIVNSTYRRGEESRIWLHLGRVLDR